MSVDPRAGLRALEDAAASGELGEVARRHRIRILSVFGSSARPEGEPADLDVAVGFEPGAHPDVLALLEDLARLCGREVDLMDLRRAGPVAAERALAGSIALYESESGAFATAQMAAMTMRMETDWMRRHALEALRE
jgi:predicted nucleotidyltransferase